MPDEHPQGVPDPALRPLKAAINAVLLIAVSAALFAFRKTLVGSIVTGISFLIWSLNTAGAIIPQQVLWALLLLVLLYVAVGSFYGRKLGDLPSRPDTRRQIGPVEARAGWIEDSAQGTYFKWRLANQLGRVSQAVRAEKNDDSQLPPGVRAYLNAGLNTSFADYTLPGWFQKRQATPLDLDPAEVVAALEKELEIHDEG